MWLLDANTYNLKFFLVPPKARGTYHAESKTYAREGGYAILSHTWEDDEVTFDDIQHLESARRKKGFQKIELTCRQALKDNLSHAWIDTCCIDKRSSAELSEAINSMFAWYKQATVCYVYLADLDCQQTAAELQGVCKKHRLRITDLETRKKCIHLDSPGWCHHEVDPIRRCRWFSRGWTLQELIAPESVWFFDKHWTEFGTKHNMAYLISGTTGIPLAVLSYPNALRHVSVAQRLSWAASRQTTRAEDQAYSLLGLLDVNMPLLYGEGSKALKRLQEQYLKQTNDQSLFLWSRRPSAKGSPLLAPSLTCFEQQRIIVHFDDGETMPGELSSVGYRATMSVVRAEHGQLLVVLNCRYEDSAHGRIRLPVVALGTHASSREDLSKPLRVATKESYKPYPSISTEELRGARQRELLITSMGSEQEWQINKNPRRYGSIRGDSSFHQHFKIRSVQPKHHWVRNTDSRASSDDVVLRQGSWYLGDPETQYSIVWQSKTNDAWLCFLCVYQQSVGQWDRDTFMLKIQELPAEPNKSEILDMLSPDDGSTWLTLSGPDYDDETSGTAAPSVTGRTMLSSGASIDVSIVESSIMGDLFCMVDIQHVSQDIEPR